MIHIKPSHLALATAAPVAILVLAAVLAMSRGRAPAPTPPKANDLADETKVPEQAWRARSAVPAHPGRWRSPPTALTRSGRSWTAWARDTATR